MPRLKAPAPRVSLLKHRISLPHSTQAAIRADISYPSAGRFWIILILIVLAASAGAWVMLRP